MKTVIIHKNLGETPLEALERFRLEQIKKSDNNLISNSTKLDSVTDNSINWKKIPMTYAGRLDPVAEGELLILIGEECKNKEKYLGLDKEYEVEILLGLTTDTYDILGLVTNISQYRSTKSIDFSKYIIALSIKRTKIFLKNE